MRKIKVGGGGGGELRMYNYDSYKEHHQKITLCYHYFACRARS